MPKGTIVRLICDNSFGFIRMGQGEEIFFSRSQLQGVDYSSLREGQKVEFEVAQGPDGCCAARVRLSQSKDEQKQVASQIRKRQSSKRELKQQK